MLKPGILDPSTGQVPRDRWCHPCMLVKLIRVMFPEPLSRSPFMTHFRSLPLANVASRTRVYAIKVLFLHLCGLHFRKLIANCILLCGSLLRRTDRNVIWLWFSSQKTDHKRFCFTTFFSENRCFEILNICGLHLRKLITNKNYITSSQIIINIWI